MTQEAPEYAVTLKMQPEVAQQLSHGSQVLDLANALELDPADPADDARAAAANEQMRAAIARSAELDRIRLEVVRPAREVIERMNSNFVPTIKALGDAVEVWKAKLGKWQQGKKAIADAAAKKAADEARAAAEESRRRAAQEEARRQEEARIAAEKEAAAKAEAEAARVAAEEAAKRNDPIAQAAAQREARRQAEAAAREAERQTQLTAESERRAREEAMAQAAAQAAARAATAPAPTPVLTGLGGRENWIAEFADGENEDSVKLKIMMAIVGVRQCGPDKLPQPSFEFCAPRPELMPLLELDMGQVKRFAKAQKQHTNIPGMTARDDRIITSRKAG